MTFVWIESSDHRYPEWVALRQRILRDPLGLEYSTEDLATERQQRHLLGIIEERVVGGLIVQPTETTSAVWKIRQVAVAESLQGQGIGRALMERVMADAIREQVKSLTLHSREGVIGFYEKLGFRVEGEPFVEVGIPHRKMRFDPASA